MRPLFLFVILGTVSYAQQVSQVASEYSIVGIVQGSDGLPINGAVVTLTARPPYRTKNRVKEWTAVTSSNGSFAFEHLYSGELQICADAPATTWLDPCRWGPKPTLITLSEKAPASSLTIRLDKGLLVFVRVVDAAAVLDKSEAAVAGADLLIGLSNDNGTWEPVELTSRDLTGRTYQIKVPFDKPINLTAASSLFGLTTGDSTPVQRNGITVTKTFTALSGKTPPTINFAVVSTGRQ